MTLCIFFKTNPWFNACFKFLMCITYSSLSCKFVTSFSVFSVFILSGTKGKSCEGYVNFQDIEHQPQDLKNLYFYNHVSCICYWLKHTDE